VTGHTTPPPATTPRHDGRQGLQPQFRNENWTFVLDGRVVEWPVV